MDLYTKVSNETLGRLEDVNLCRVKQFDNNCTIYDVLNGLNFESKTGAYKAINIFTGSSFSREVCSLLYKITEARLDMRNKPVGFVLMKLLGALNNPRDIESRINTTLYDMGMTLGRVVDKKVLNGQRDKDIMFDLNISEQDIKGYMEAYIMTVANTEYWSFIVGGQSYDKVQPDLLVYYDTLNPITLVSLNKGAIYTLKVLKMRLSGYREIEELVDKLHKSCNVYLSTLRGVVVDLAKNGIIHVNGINPTIDNGLNYNVSENEANGNTVNKTVYIDKGSELEVLEELKKIIESYVNKGYRLMKITRDNDVNRFKQFLIVMVRQ